ncbi:hypothetical protein ES703_66471 [subsurface metagenome]
MKQVQISENAFSKVIIEKDQAVAAKEKMRKVVHNLLDEWLDKPSYHHPGDGIIFNVVEDQGG